MVLRRVPFFAPDHMQRGSVSYLKPLRWRAPSRLHLPTELRVHRTKQTLIFAFIAAQCTQTIKIHTIQLSRAQENKRTWSLSKYACLWVFWQCPCMTAVLVWFDCRNSSCCSGRGQMFLWLFTFTFQLFSFLKLLWKHSSQFTTASSSTGLSGSAWRVCRPLQTQRCVHLLSCFAMYFRPLVYKSKMCLGGVLKITSFFKILQRHIVWLLVFGKLNEQWGKKYQFTLESSPLDWTCCFLQRFCEEFQFGGCKKNVHRAIQATLCSKMPLEPMIAQVAEWTLSDSKAMVQSWQSVLEQDTKVSSASRMCVWLVNPKLHFALCEVN